MVMSFDHRHGHSSFLSWSAVVCNVFGCPLQPSVSLLLGQWWWWLFVVVVCCSRQTLFLYMTLNSDLYIESLPGLLFYVCCYSSFFFLLSSFFFLLSSSFLSPANRGSFITGFLVLFILLGAVGGFYSARMYKTLK